MPAIVHDSCRRQSIDESVEAFEAMLPSIRRVANYAFRRFPRWKREELINDVIALAFRTFARLVERGKKVLGYPTVLARFAIRQVRAGREVGVRQNVKDVLSPLAQRQKGFVVELMADRSQRRDWEELADSGRSTPAEIVAFRLDFESWLSRLQKFKRHVALRLACGDTTCDAARYFQISNSRVSQIRQELKLDWDQFQGLSAV